MKINISAITDIGRERENNEDACAFCPNVGKPSWPEKSMSGYEPLSNYGSFIVVADGMGGPNAGEVAASIAIDCVKKTFSDKDVTTAASEEDDKAKALMNQTIVEADKAINQRIIDDPDTAGMGTTIVLCWVMPGKAHIAWCGDSRCYRYNDADGLEPLTKDHSYVQQLIDKGDITAEEALSHPDSNIITRGLGDFDTAVQPDFVTVSISAGDTLLLCSDGLCGYNTDSQIEQVFKDSDGSATQSTDQLLRLALDAGGYDNISIAVASVVDDDVQTPGSPRGLWAMLKSLFRH